VGLTAVGTEGAAVTLESGGSWRGALELDAKPGAGPGGSVMKLVL
jgi:hypothetical protein